MKEVKTFSKTTWVMKSKKLLMQGFGDIPQQAKID